MCALDRQFNQYLKDANSIDRIKRIGFIEQTTDHTIREWLLILFLVLAAIG